MAGETIVYTSLPRLASIKLAKGPGAPSGEGMGCLDEEGAEQWAARFADAALAPLIA